MYLFVFKPQAHVNLRNMIVAAVPSEVAALEAFLQDE
jgi:hypothetical protein